MHSCQAAVFALFSSTVVLSENNMASSCSAARSGAYACSPFSPAADLAYAPQCVAKCTEKFLKHSARVSLRFQELNVGAMEGQQARAPPGRTCRQQPAAHRSILWHQLPGSWEVAGFLGPPSSSRSRSSPDALSPERRRCLGRSARAHPPTAAFSRCPWQA